MFGYALLGDELLGGDPALLVARPAQAASEAASDTAPTSGQIWPRGKQRGQ